ncbi:MAG: hypothetical protein K0S33_379 [Bacteroidetes bacterium]|jgi:hypothetical protein|nr:hypothetical protein [Bacteroidota bacterium]
MKKAILVLICVFVTLGSYAQDAVSISHNLPATISPGQSIDADFTISKGSVGGFAKFQMDLPFGFSASNIDSKGGNFTYENQRVKIVWVSVPGDASFTFKFKMTIPANAVNSCSVSSKFFYLENNVKKEVEMAMFTMRIEGSGAVASTPTETVISTPTETVTSTPTTTITETVTSTPTTTYTTEPVATNTVVSTPTETVTPTTTITETVTSTPTTTYTTEPVATNTVVATPTVSSTTTDVVYTPPSISEKTTSTSSSTSGSSGMIYKVQLGAFSNATSKSKFPGANVTIVQEGGYYKALSGNFTTIEQAMKHKSDLASKGYDCFIVFYQNGQRIGIQK